MKIQNFQNYYKTLNVNKILININYKSKLFFSFYYYLFFMLTLHVIIYDTKTKKHKAKKISLCVFFSLDRNVDYSIL